MYSSCASLGILIRQRFIQINQKARGKFGTEIGFKIMILKPTNCAILGLRSPMILSRAATRRIATEIKSLPLIWPRIQR